MTWDCPLVSSGSLDLLWFLSFLILDDSAFFFWFCGYPRALWWILVFAQSSFLQLAKSHNRYTFLLKNHKSSSCLFLCCTHFYIYEFYFYMSTWFYLMSVGFVFVSVTNSFFFIFYFLFFSFAFSARKPILRNFWDRAYKWSDSEIVYIWECHLFDITHKWQHSHPQVSMDIALLFRDIWCCTKVWGQSVIFFSLIIPFPLFIYLEIFS